MSGVTYDQAGVEELAGQVARTLHAGDAVLLSGPLGAGKTTFARALIRATCGVATLEVPSPSYTLVQSYDMAGDATSGLVLHHFDLWRLDGPESLVELGWEDARAGVVVVEWPDRLGVLTPEPALHISFQTLAGELRAITVEDARRPLGVNAIAPRMG